MGIILHSFWNPYLSPISLSINIIIIGESNNLFPEGLSFSIPLLFSPNQVLPGIHLHIESEE